MSGVSRRDFLGTTGRIAAGAALASTVDLRSLAAAPAPQGNAGGPASSGRMRVAIVGTGIRATRAWGRDLLAEHGERVEIVGLCDVNIKRAEASRRIIGIEAPLYTELRRMLRETRPDALVVTTRDDTHDEQIVQALHAGVDVITEKPMTTDAAATRRVLDAERRTGRKVTVAFNYRYAPTAARIKELLLAGTIGEVTSIDFHWYLDNRHGADYFRRWHAYRKHGGTLWVHKATHHFDLVNWYLGAEPVEVSAQGALRRYGRNGTFRGVNCRTCKFTDRCDYYWDVTKDPLLTQLYVEAESVDGYLRDGCVYREDVDVYDTMAATVRYSNGTILSYSVNAYMPIEGYHLAFNGPKGRIEVRMHERQPWDVPRGIDEIRVTGAFGPSEVISVPWGPGGHYGGDVKLREMLFVPGTPDPLGQRASARAGAMSVLTGVAADQSILRRGPVQVADLISPRFLSRLRG